MDATFPELHARIGQVLLKSWDPLDVAGRPEGDPARARYVGDVVALLATGASDRQLAEHLVRLETQRLGWQDSRPASLRPTAKKLRLLYRRLTAETRAV